MVNRFCSWLVIGAVCALGSGLSLRAFADKTAKATTAILVDKKTSNLLLTEYVDGAYKIIKTYHATLGQVKGDKEDEGDLKTPEGIYTFKARMTAPALARKFGSLAFYMNFPNTFDELAGHKGSNIMLHATDTPGRLKNNYDSLGCIVVNDQEIHEIEPRVRVGLTPILIFTELTDVYLKPGQDTGLKDFFYSWIKSWEAKDLEHYIDHYHSDFSANGKNKSQWKEYKASLNSRYATIEINPERVLFYRHPKYSMITFTQNYRSKLKRGGWGHRSTGTKILYVAEEAGHPKIIAETYTNLMW
ncbi:L,D-transpeptidase family protein [Bdellovibrionota bacterium FG-1]